MFKLGLKKRLKLKEYYNKRMIKQNKCTEIVIMMKLENGKGTMVRTLLDSGCSETIVLKGLLKRIGEKYYLLKNKSNIKLMVAIL